MEDLDNCHVSLACWMCDISAAQTPAETPPVSGVDFCVLVSFPKFANICLSRVRGTGPTSTAWGRAAPQTELSTTAPAAPESLTATFLICGPANHRSCSRTAWKTSVLYGGRSATAFLIASSTDFRVQAAPMVTPVNKQRQRIVVLQNVEVQKDGYNCVCKA